MFLFLKQGKLDPLTRALDYFIERQQRNKTWELKLSDKDRYDKLLSQLTRSFARFVAILDRDYIFAWLDWDGDNVLADAGIIDYGSVRQFGLRHDQYRYDDVERMSTNLNEQCSKTREMMQTFVQLVDFVKSGEKKPWRQFKNNPWLKEFDSQVKHFTLDRLLYQVGFPEPLRRILLNKHRREVEAFFKIHGEFERQKTHRKLKKVADGVHRPAIFNMRLALAQMSDYLHGLPFEMFPPVESREFFSWILTGQANAKDSRLTAAWRRRITLWQKCYVKLVRKVSGPATWDKTTQLIATRASRINHGERITGNALIHIVDEILRFRRRGLSDAEVQVAIEELITAQTLNPDFKSPQFTQSESLKTLSIVSSFLSVVHGFREDI